LSKITVASFVHNLLMFLTVPFTIQNLIIQNGFNNSIDAIDNPMSIIATSNSLWWRTQWL